MVIRRAINPEAIAPDIGNARPRLGSKHPDYKLEIAGLGADRWWPRIRDVAALPALVRLRGAVAPPGTQQRSRQAMIARPGHHLHRTLHRNIDWSAKSDAPFEPRRLQIGKPTQIGSHYKLEAITNWQAITNWKDNRAPRGFDGRDGNGCSGN
jgi:hypothetical protein